MEMKRPGTSLVTTLLRKARREFMLTAFAVVLFAFALADPELIGAYPGFVDWPTIHALAGLMIITTALEESGLFHHLARRITALAGSQRGLALLLVTAAALLSMALTNDIALFIMVPLSLALGGKLHLDLGRLVIFEALAVNAGSTLTPIGNPQNLFLWHQAGVSFFGFVYRMLPLELLLMGLLLGFTWLAFAPQPLRRRPGGREGPVRRLLFGAAAAAFVAFLVCIELGLAAWGLAGVALLTLLLARRVLLRVDWALLILFLLMFVDLHLLSLVPAVRGWLEGLGLADPRRLFVAGVAASQVLSNVPAAMLLAKFTSRWDVLAFAVNLGGSGLVLGSLANLIALRLAGQEAGGRRLWLRFHWYSVPFLLVSCAAAYAMFSLVGW